MNLSIDSEIFKRGVAEILTEVELENILKSDRKLRIKHGIDATSPFLHLGHAANLWKIRQLQEHGHKAVILLGDVTTQIGDPTGKSKTRPIIPLLDIEKNLKSIRNQVESILLTNPGVYEFRRNSEWFNSMSLVEFLKIVSLVTHARLIERDMFQERTKKGEEISMSEILYPVLQGYDSVCLKADLTVIGSDQIFNEHLGRMLQEKFRQPPQVIVALKIISGIDGEQKMSKSAGNYIGLLDSPEEKFGKSMRIGDNMIIPYLEAYTDVPEKTIRGLEDEIKKDLNPMQAKLFLAESLVARYHGKEVAREARERFMEIFSKKEIPDNLPSRKTATGERDMIELLVELNLTSSRSEARRMLKQKAVEVDGVVWENAVNKVKIKKGTVIKVGKRKFVKIS